MKRITILILALAAMVLAGCNEHDENIVSLVMGGMALIVLILAVFGDIEIGLGGKKKKQ